MQAAELAHTSKLENVAMFEKFCSVAKESKSGINQQLQDKISQLRDPEALVEEMKRYFSELKGDEAAVVGVRYLTWLLVCPIAYIGL